MPTSINKAYALALVEVFLTNGNGVARSAEPFYRQMLNQFDETQALYAILSFNNTHIASRLQFHLCQQKFKELLGILESKVTSSAIRELIEDIKQYKGPLDKMRDDSRIKRKVTNLQKIIN